MFLGPTGYYATDLASVHPSNNSLTPNDTSNQPVTPTPQQPTPSPNPAPAPAPTPSPSPGPSPSPSPSPGPSPSPKPTTSSQFSGIDILKSGYVNDQGQYVNTWKSPAEVENGYHTTWMTDLSNSLSGQAR